MSLTCFTSAGPWDVDLGAMAWRGGIEAIRDAASAKAVELSRGRAVPDLGRLAELTLGIGGAIGRWLVHDRTDDDQASRRRLSRRMRDSAVSLGPTYIKLGQVVSSGDGIFPAEIVEEMRLLRDRVRPERFEVVRALIERELGRPIEAVFSHLDETPVASASVAQVHYATLRTGEEVAVKVQRPTVAATVERDLSVLAWMAPLLRTVPAARLANPPAIVDYLADTVVEELDFRLEADNMIDVARVLDASGQDAIVVPRPHPTLVTERVLVMERLDGFAIDDVASMRAAGIDPHAVMRAVSVMLWEGSLIYGVFHGDLHGGNLRVMRDGRVALLDFGITGRIEPSRRPAFLRMIIAGLANDPRGQLEALRDLGTFSSSVDLDALVGELDLTWRPGEGRPVDRAAEGMQSTIRTLLASGFRVPRELLLLVKNFVYLNGATAVLAPDMDVIAEIVHLATYLGAAHGPQIVAETGLDLASLSIDPEALFAGVPNLDPDQPVTFRTLRSSGA